MVTVLFASLPAPYNRPLSGQFTVENCGFFPVAYRINYDSHWLTFTPKEGIISSQVRANIETIHIDVKPILGLNFKLHFGEFDRKKQKFDIKMTFVKEAKPSFANSEDEESAFDGSFLESPADLIARTVSDPNNAIISQLDLSSLQFEKAKPDAVYKASVGCKFDSDALGEFEDDLIGKMPLTIRPSTLTFNGSFTAGEGLSPFSPQWEFPLFLFHKLAPFTPSCQAVFTLKNSKSSDYTFRVLLSDTQRYTAQPSEGVIAKGNRDDATFLNISIYLGYKFLGVDRSKDSISVLVATIADNARDFVTVVRFS